MAYDNLDAQDKEICEALERGVAVEEICAQLGVEASKVESLKSVVLENAGAEVEAPEELNFSEKGDTEIGSAGSVGTDEPASEEVQGETFQG